MVLTVTVCNDGGELLCVGPEKLYFFGPMSGSFFIKLPLFFFLWQI